ncbi:tetratricopeptide repeat protein [Siphonobacter sp. SORGH_AS_1065]|uniref:tetratricopeptide repeat protein n=1 Tax=Siphonobacter sp. SORGH_AS_1065 TaxID=3041795 RepID=UPI002786608F|nr:tetratricopeptide repeat protein [Siphonobacter sp. SORGH_AS_1065]MDQ1090042.1 tetratricopeptide (TPR) repeat protein [Siphonobacter sp. SORGH_AS_1065]
MDIIKVELERAQKLIDLRRIKDAIQILNQILVKEPENEEILLWLTYAYMQDHQYQNSLTFSEKVLSVAPAFSTAYYYRALSLYNLNRYQEASVDLGEAIRLEPMQASYYGLLGTIYYESKILDKALDLASQGLTIDPENTYCLNLKVQVLTKLGRIEQMRSGIKESLSIDPLNTYSHTVAGWSLLERGKPSEARKHFAESLRVNPANQNAQKGMKEAVKAKNPIYRAYLNYTFWSEREELGLQGLIGSIVSGLLPALRKDHVEWLLLFATIGGLIFIISYVFWIIRPLGYLILESDKWGKLVLEKRQKYIAYSMALMYSIGLLAFILYYYLPSYAWLLLGAYSLFIIIPITHIVDPEYVSGIFEDQLTMLMIALSTAGVITAFSNFFVGLGMVVVAFAVMIAYKWTYHIVQIWKKNN